MNSKLTVRNLVKYWGCKVKCDNCHFPELEYWFTYITAQYITLYAATKPAGIIREIGFSQIKISDCQLLLTPLPAITDEHAIEVAKIASIGKYEAKECIGCDKDDYKTIGKYIVADFNYPTYIDIRIHTDKYIKIIDLLRSLGYDCDNAISEGWAVDRLANLK